MFKLLTWNILHKDFVQDDKFLNWDERFTLIKKMIDSVDADIICLQEVDLDNIDEFKQFGNIVYQDDKRRIKAYNKWKMEESKKPNTSVLAIITKGEILSHEVGSRTLSAKIRMNGMELTVSNVHLETKRIATYELQRKHIDKLLKSDIICGDFNDFPDSEIIQYMEQTYGKSIYNDRFPITFVGQNNWCLDYVFSKYNIVEYTIDPIIYMLKDGIYPSDHARVVVELGF